MLEGQVLLVVSTLSFAGLLIYCSRYWERKSKCVIYCVIGIVFLWHGLAMSDRNSFFTAQDLLGAVTKTPWLMVAGYDPGFSYTAAKSIEVGTSKDEVEARLGRGFRLSNRSWMYGWPFSQKVAYSYFVVHFDDHKTTEYVTSTEFRVEWD